MFARLYSRRASRIQTYSRCLSRVCGSRSPPTAFSLRPLDVREGDEPSEANHHQDHNRVPDVRMDKQIDDVIADRQHAERQHNDTTDAQLRPTQTVPCWPNSIRLFSTLLFSTSHDILAALPVSLNSCADINVFRMPVVPVRRPSVVAAGHYQRAIDDC